MNEQKELRRKKELDRKKSRVDDPDHQNTGGSGGDSSEFEVEEKKPPKKKFVKPDVKPLSMADLVGKINNPQAAINKLTVKANLKNNLNASTNSLPEDY